MKNYFGFVLILLSMNRFCQSATITNMGESLPQKIERTGALEPNGPFYLISNGMIIYNLNQLNDVDGNRFYKYRKDWLHKKAAPWKTVKISELEPLGLKEGMTFKFVEFNGSPVKEYKLKKDVHLAMVGDDFFGESPDILFYRTFYIVLNDSLEGLEHPGSPNADNVTGIAYIGSEYKLKPTHEVNGSELDSLPKIEQQKNKDLAEYYLSLTKKPRSSETLEITDLSFDTHKLYFLESKSKPSQKEEPHKILVLKAPNNNFVEVPAFSTGPSVFYNRFSHFIEGSDLTILQERDSMHSCYKLIIYKKNKKNEFQMMCNSGGC